MKDEVLAEETGKKDGSDEEEEEEKEIRSSPDDSEKSDRSSENDDDDDDVVGGGEEEMDGATPMKITIDPSPSPSSTEGDQITTTKTTETRKSRRLSWPPSSASKIQSLLPSSGGGGKEEKTSAAAGVEANAADNDDGKADELRSVKEKIKRQVLGRKTEHERRDIKLYVVDDDGGGKKSTSAKERDKKSRAASESQLLGSDAIAIEDRKRAIARERTRTIAMSTSGGGGGNIMPAIPESPLISMLRKNNEGSPPPPSTSTPKVPAKTDWTNNVFFKTEYVPIPSTRMMMMENEEEEEEKAKRTNGNERRCKLPDVVAKWEKPIGKGRKMMLERLERQRQPVESVPPPMLMYSKTWKGDLKEKLERRRLELRKSTAKSVRINVD